MMVQLVRERVPCTVLSIPPPVVAVHEVTAQAHKREIAPVVEDSAAGTRHPKSHRRP